MSRAVDATHEGETARAHALFRKVKTTRKRHEIVGLNGPIDDLDALLGRANNLQYRLAASARRELAASERGDQGIVRRERAVQRAISSRYEAMLDETDIWKVSDRGINNQQFDEEVKWKHRYLDNKWKVGS